MFNKSRTWLVPAGSFAVALLLAAFAGPTAATLARIPRQQTSDKCHQGSIVPASEDRQCTIDGVAQPKTKTALIDLNPSSIPEMATMQSSASCEALMKDGSGALHAAVKGPAGHYSQALGNLATREVPSQVAKLFIDKIRSGEKCCHPNEMSVQGELQGQLRVGAFPGPSFALARIGGPPILQKVGMSAHEDVNPKEREPVTGHAGGQWDTNCNFLPEGRFERHKLWATVRANGGVGGGRCQIFAFEIIETEVITEGKSDLVKTTNDLSVPPRDWSTHSGIEKSFKSLRPYGFTGLVRQFEQQTFASVGIENARVSAFTSGINGNAFQNQARNVPAPDAFASVLGVTRALKLKDTDPTDNIVLELLVPKP